MNENLVIHGTNVKYRAEVEKWVREHPDFVGTLRVFLFGYTIPKTYEIEAGKFRMKRQAKPLKWNEVQ